MANTHDNLSNGKCLHPGDRSPENLFGYIRSVFTDLGALNRDIAVVHEGIRYRITCNDISFMVYRVNESGGPRHHMPGWPVCLVNEEVIFEECSSPGLAEDHCSCLLDIETWLQMVRHQCQPRC